MNESGNGRTSGNNNYTYAMFCHLSALSTFIGVPLGNILLPLVLWLIKKEEDPYVDKQGKESLNFQISIIIYFFGLLIIALILIGAALLLRLPEIFVFSLMGLFALLLMSMTIAYLILVIIASIQTSKGIGYKYPATIRLIR